MWWKLLIGIFVYVFFRESINKKIAEVKKWLKLNKDTLGKWKDNQQVMNAYKDLKTAFDLANMDKKWDAVEIITVLGLAIRLFKLIKEVEEG